MSSTESSPEPKRRVGRKAIPKEQHKRRSWKVCCPQCKHQFDFAHKDPTVKPDPITTPEMDAKQKNKVYQARYRAKHKQNKLNDNDIECQNNTST